MFDRVARRYDLLNDFMSMRQHRRWRALAGELSHPSGAVVLDLATGTGDLAILCYQAGAQQVVGVDFSAAMLTAAQSKLARRNIEDEIGLIQADAHHLPFSDASFDALTSAFLLRNLADLDAALREMRRVLKPGGRLVALDMTPAGQGPLGILTRWYFRTVMPALGGILSGEWAAYRYLPRSVEAFPSAEALATRVREAGFRDVAFRRMGLSTVAIHTAQA
jgi:demethylmenaquinone methyltransferase / 2-methoxy-6-polyprenyl-1,4-benzoquinol methylase